MRFSICIPNYNYERYLGRTLSSVVSQSHRDLEVVIADNCSTDRSVAIATGFGDERIKVAVNRCNVGFAGNLDKAASLASGDLMVMLSSDDLVRAEALATYAKVFEHVGPRSVVCSTMDKIDPDDSIIGRLGPSPSMYRLTERDDALSSVVGAPVYRVPAASLLERALRTMTNPFNFAATAYPRTAWQALEGYGGGRLINPDKWYHWRLLGEVDEAIFIDRPLFAYRWHPQNQAALESKQGALKYMVDEYSSTLEASDALLRRASMDRAALVEAFVEYDVARHGLSTLANGDARKARRILDFGRAVYPLESSRNRKVAALRALLLCGTAGRSAASSAYEIYNRRFRGAD